MELQVTTDIEHDLPQAVGFNFEQLKGQIAEKLKKYQGVVITEDGVKDAKKDRATLNKLKSALDNKRMEVKKEWNRPFDEFENKIKELIGMVDAPVKAIDVQIKGFEEQKKQEKAAGIRAFFGSEIGEFAELIPFDKIDNPRWLNASYKMTDIEKEISNSISKAKNNVGIIKAMGLKCEQQMLDVYFRTLDMSAAMSEKTRWEEQQKRLKKYEEDRERKRQEKAQREAEELETRQNEQLSKATAPIIETHLCHAEQPRTIVIDGTPGHDLCDARPGDHVMFGGSPEMPFDEEPQEQLKTIKVIFYDTTEAFRHEMKALTDKHEIRYGGLK